MCGCVADKAAVDEQQKREAQTKENEGALCSCGSPFTAEDTCCKKCGKVRPQEKQSSESLPSNAPPPQPPPDEGEDTVVEEPERIDPMTLETLQEALVASLALNLQQLKAFRRWWKAMGLGMELPRDAVYLSLDGDGSALEVSVAVSPKLVLSIIPTLLSLVPEGVPSPPSAKSASGPPVRKFEPQQVCMAIPPLELQTEVSVQPLRRFHREALFMAMPETEGDNLPTKISDGGRPRGKAKAKSRIQKLDENPPSTETPSNLGETGTLSYQPLIFPDEKKVVSQSTASQEPHAPPLPSVREREAVREPPLPTKVLEPSAELEPLKPFQQTPQPMAQEQPEPMFSAKDYSEIPKEAPERPSVTEHRPMSQPHPVVSESARAKASVKKPDLETVRQLIYDDAPDFGEHDDYSLAAKEWKHALTRAIAELDSSCVVVWLQLGGLGLPNGVPRPIDVGVRIRAAHDSDTFRLIEPYEDVAESLEDSGITMENGWIVTDMGCSLFAHGPLVSFSVEAQRRNAQCDKLLEKVAPAALAPVAKSIASGSDIQIGVRAGTKNGDLLLGACFQLMEGAKVRCPGKDLQSLAVDFALGKEKLFDPFLVERVRQMLASMGGISDVSSIECRANDMALITLRVTPCSDGGKHSV